MNAYEYGLGVASPEPKKWDKSAFEELVASAFRVKLAKERAVYDEMVRLAWVGSGVSGPLVFEEMVDSVFAVNRAAEKKRYEELARLARLGIQVYGSADEE